MTEAVSLSGLTSKYTSVPVCEGMGADDDCTLGKDAELLPAILNERLNPNPTTSPR